MPHEVERLSLVSRFTTIIGASIVRTKPIDIQRYASANLVAWAGAANGSGTGLSVQAQESMDLNTWRDVGSALSPVAGEATGERDFEQRWFRLELTLIGTDAAVTCWATGEFVLRGR